MITRNTWVRDTLIRVDILQTLPTERQQAIVRLYTEFKGLGYIDARTEIGPDQYARMSQKRRDHISTIASRVFRIEQEIKKLMKSDEQLEQERLQIVAKAKEEKIRQLQHRKETIEQFCYKKLKSKRDNSTKREYEAVNIELHKLV